MIQFLASLIIAVQPVIVSEASPAPSLHERGWELVWSRETGYQRRAYVHPESIRPRDQSVAEFSVTSIVEWRNGKDEDIDAEWRINTNAYVVNCAEKTLRHDWSIDRYEGKPLPNYTRLGRNLKPKGYQEAVVERVCAKR